MISALAARATRSPEAIAVTDGCVSLSVEELHHRVSDAADRLRLSGCRVLALLADNGIDWVVADLAAAMAGIPLVPVPPFFTPAQVAHLYASAGVDLVLCAAQPGADGERLDWAVGRLSAWRREGDETVSLPPGTGKVTYTSGSTGTPRGVCLGFDGLGATATALASRLGDLGVDRHLCVMPLSMLLENVAGVYASLLLGATVCVPPLAEVGLSGASGFDAAVLDGAIETHAAQSIILLPQLLRDLARYRLAEGHGPSGLRFAAVGGARVTADDIHLGHEAGIPVYQGYGLSECNSVIALNRPGEDRVGSVGRVLPGVSVRIAPDGEIVVAGASMRGYLGDAGNGADEVATGDLGYVDDDGYLYITGRRKNLFITSYGRNVSPEWPESELEHQPEIAQCLVDGEGMPFNTALVVPAGPGVDADAIDAAIERANRALPDYARISEWRFADEPFSVANGLLTPTGKLRRDAIRFRYFHGPEARPDLQRVSL